MKRMVATIAAAFLLTGCAPEAGQITDRDYDDPDTHTTTSCTGSGKSRSCTPVTRHDPESYSLHLDDGHDAGWVGVPEDEYHACHVDDQYPACAKTKALR